MLACLFVAPPVSADVNIWYEISTDSASADGVDSVSQGASGQPLIITVERRVTEYALTISCKANVTEDDALIGYAIDLIAPTSSLVSSVEDDFIYLSPFGMYLPPSFGTGPGEIISGAAEFDLTGHFGEMTLFSFILRINGEVLNDIDIYSGIGDFLWGTTANMGIEIQFADSDLLDGEVDGGVSSTPSIIIQPLGGSVDDCNILAKRIEDEIADDPSLDCNTNGILDECDIDEGTSTDCDGNNVPDECDLAADPALDCNTNGVLDSCDIQDETSIDCNENGVPDECDLAAADSLDCNENDIPDECDIAAGTSADCNGNGVPDSCDIATEASLDCNANGVPDTCDLAEGTSEDCNGNALPDECEITIGSVTDCNANGVPDECDIADGTSLDADGNGVPDECVSPGSQDQPEDTTSTRVFNREELRSFLMLLFNLPGEGRPPISGAPLYLFDVFGIPMSAAMLVMETISLPARMLMFTFTYFVMDAILP